MKTLAATFLVFCMSVPAFAREAVFAEKYTCAALQNEIAKRGTLKLWSKDLFGYYISTYHLTADCTPDETVNGPVRIKAKDTESCYIGYQCFWNPPPTGGA